MDYFQYKRKEVRDLAWVIRSAFLICDERHSYQDDFSLHHYRLMENFLISLDKNPSDLYSFLGQLRSPFLGHYFEKLVMFWIKHDPEIELLANNIQIKEEGRTKGEIDLIFDYQGSQEHWELAVKFYMGTGSGEHLNQWIGPNPVDRFDLKLGKILNQQLELSKTEAAAGKLSTLGVDIQERKHFIKGYLYYPLGSDIKPLIHANEFHNRSWWIYEDQLDLLDQKYLVRKEKRHWLSPDIFSQEDLVPVSKIPQLLRSRKRLKPQLFSIVEKDGKHYRELSSGFIAMRNWPERI